MRRFILLMACWLAMVGLDAYSVEHNECAGNEAGICLSDADSTYFFNHYFLRPKMREFRFMINPNINADSVIARSLLTNNTVLSEKFAVFATNNLTDEGLGLIAEQRRLAADYCSLGWDGVIKIGISKNVAVAMGISTQAYENIESWVNSVNRHQETDWDKNTTFAYYQVYFDDNVRNPQNDVIIRTPAK